MKSVVGCTFRKGPKDDGLVHRQAVFVPLLTISIIPSPYISDAPSFLPSLDVSFPEKLHRMLEAVEREGNSDVVSFFSHGRAFAIHKPRRFVLEIMARFFRQTRLTSFQRQLNLYGFRRISQGPDNGGYYHELFLKGRPGLCVNMKRTKVKGSSKLKRDPDSEREFDTMQHRLY